jgi:hypothetical protein
MRASRLVPIVLFAALFSAMPFHAALAAAAPDLRSASNFAVLSAAPSPAGAVTCTTSKINGEVGSSGLAASVVQTGCVITGAIIAPVAPVVLTDFDSAYGKYAAIPCTGSLNTVYTGATTLTPGVYCNTADVTFTNATLTLDGQGHANAVWIFKIGTGGTGALTGTGFSVVMAGGGQPCNVYWWIAEAATMTTTTGTTVGFKGTILAGAAITITGKAGTPTTTSFNGDALAKAAVTLKDVNLTGCGIGKGPGNGDGECGDKGDKGDKDKDKDKDHDKGDNDKDHNDDNDKHGNG